MIRQNDELINRLRQDGATGLDLSPGNPLSKEAADEIESLNRLLVAQGRISVDLFDEAKRIHDSERGLMLKIERLVAALEPFARMHREGSDPDEVACERGMASDMTILTSGDFAMANQVLNEVNSLGQDVLVHQPPDTERGPGHDDAG